MTIEVFEDPILSMIDDLADLCEIWKKRREKDITPSALRLAIMTVSKELIEYAKNKT